MTGAVVSYGNETMLEMRLDAGKAPRFGAAAQPKHGFDALPDTQHAIYPLLMTPEGPILPSQRTGIR